MAAVALLAGPSLASAQSVPNTPTISGTLQVGKTLTATSGGATGPGGTETGHIWLRCDDQSDDRCTWLSAYDRSYTLVPADLNHYMRVISWARRGYSYAYKLSNSTGRVTAAPTPTPTPVKTPTPTATPVKTPVKTPTPTATPVKTPVKTPTPAATPVKTPPATATVTPGGTVPPVATPAPTPDFDLGAQPTPDVEPIAQPDPGATQAPSGDVLGASGTKKQAKMLRPYPVVRISGRLTTGGANIQVLSVKAPKGAKVRVKCSGKGCPTKAVARATKVVRISQFQRVLPAGIKLRITISKAGYISKVTTISIRKGKAPLRSDQCQMPGAKKLIRCPK